MRARLDSVRARMGQSRATLIAVSKTKTAREIAELYSLGQRDFGENYAQELVEKAQYLSEQGYTELRWHFIGHLQTNKVKAIIPWVSAVHSVDSERLARELSKRWVNSVRGQNGSKLSLFIEVNIDEEESKSGVTPGATPALAALISALPGVSLEGLMCIPKNDSAQDGSAFKRLRELELQCRPYTRGGLSMGMTQDFEVALREGATHIRVGTALFGARREPLGA